MKIFWQALMVAQLIPLVARASDAIALPLQEIERRAIGHSRIARAAESEADAAKERFSSQKSLELPKLILDGSFRYVSEVPQLPFGGGQGVKLTDNTTYSIGPALSWTLLDFGSLSNATRSAGQTFESRRQAAVLARTQALLSARNLYFKVQLTLEQMRLLRDSLKLARAQYEDIRRRSRAGTASRMDELSSHKELLQFRTQFRQSVSDLAAGLRALYVAIGTEPDADLSYPLDARLREGFEALPDEPSVSAWVSLDPIGEVLRSMKVPQKPTPSHPRVLQVQHQAEASRSAAAASLESLWPRFQLLAKTSLDYPNGPVLERIHQNTVSLSMSMPLFEFSRTAHEAQEKTAQAISQELRRDQARDELFAEWNTAQDQLAGLQAQRESLKLGVEESGELSRLIYQSYQAGRSSFLEVQSANLRALDARVQLARNEVQILMQLAVLSSLSGGL